MERGGVLRTAARGGWGSNEVCSNRRQVIEAAKHSNAQNAPTSSSHHWLRMMRVTPFLGAASHRKSASIEGPLTVDQPPMVRGIPGLGVRCFRGAGFGV